MSNLPFGWCDVCLNVKKVKDSVEFYSGLGFKKVEGNLEEGWAVMVRNEVRLGLYEPTHMLDDPFCINFRGSNVPAVVKDLQEKGYEFIENERFKLTLKENGVGSAFLKDPDGHTIFFDTMEGETKPE